MTTDYLDEVLRIAPSTWTGTTYTSANYATVQLEEETDEYTDLVRALREVNTGYGDGISRIERVQHPFAYGRFVLRQQQLENRQGSYYGQEAKRYFMKLGQCYVKQALEYNMDQRRGPYYELTTLSPRHGNECVVIVRGLQHPQHLDRDSEIYPEYVVHYDV